MRAGARRRRTHESRQCVARRISCSITSWRAAKKRAGANEVVPGEGVAGPRPRLVRKQGVPVARLVPVTRSH